MIRPGQQHGLGRRLGLRLAAIIVASTAALAVIMTGWIHPTPVRAGTVSTTGATNDASYAYYQLRFTGGQDSFYRVYIDTDNSATTGFAIGGIGADYLVENGTLYTFAGRPGTTDWNWTNGKAVASYTAAHSVVNWTVARADIGKAATPNTAGVVFQSETSGVKSTSAASTQTFVTTTTASYTASTYVIPNPERGFYRFTQGTSCDQNLFTDTQLQSWRNNDNNTLAICQFYIGNRGADIATTQLDTFDTQMAKLRANGFKAIVRFAFCEPGPCTGPNAKTTYPNGADLVFEVQNTGQAAIDSAKYTHAYAGATPVGTGTTITSYQATYDSSNVTYTFTYTGGPYSCNRVYIDADQSATTGFTIGTAGADYLLEACSTAPNSATLYRFSGTQGTNQWSWTTVVASNVTYSNTGSQASFTIPRVAISENQLGDNATSNDAPKAVVLRDLDLLAPRLQKNADVIAVVQAGLIGAWGEWYYSQFYGNAGGDPATGLSSLNWADRRDVVNKLLSVVPSNIAVQVRTPGYKQTLLSDSSPIDEWNDAFSGSYKARLGHHNDCFLRDSTDSGTYPDPVTSPTQYNSIRNYLASETQFVPMGGEACFNTMDPSNTDPSPNARSRCYSPGAAMTELAQFHWSFIDWDYNGKVIWDSTTVNPSSTTNPTWTSDGCVTDIQRYLGYRFTMVGGTFGSTVSQAAGLPVRITIRNDGWASAYNQRPVELVLKNTATGAVYRLSLNADPRRWFAGTTNVVNQTVSLTGIPTGTYALYLNLPDPVTTLNTNPLYSIQAANLGTWDTSTGYNNLNASVTITT